MNAQKTLFLFVAALVLSSATACDRSQQGKNHQVKISDDRSQPGDKGGSCSATSDDGKKTCSVSCPAGKPAYCSNTQTDVSCVCQG
jgi:hypothetical protein